MLQTVILKNKRTKAHLKVYSSWNTVKMMSLCWQVIIHQNNSVIKYKSLVVWANWQEFWYEGKVDHYLKGTIIWQKYLTVLQSNGRSAANCGGKVNKQREEHSAERCSMVRDGLPPASGNVQLFISHVWLCDFCYRPEGSDDSHFKRSSWAHRQKQHQRGNNGDSNIDIIRRRVLFCSRHLFFLLWKKRKKYSSKKMCLNVFLPWIKHDFSSVFSKMLQMHQSHWWWECHKSMPEWMMD